jgi:hypothetical protein
MKEGSKWGNNALDNDFTKYTTGKPTFKNLKSNQSTQHQGYNCRRNVTQKLLITYRLPDAENAFEL